MKIPSLAAPRCQGLSVVQIRGMSLPRVFRAVLPQSSSSSSSSSSPTALGSADVYNLRLTRCCCYRVFIYTFVFVYFLLSLFSRYITIHKCLYWAHNITGNSANDSTRIIRISRAAACAWLSGPVERLSLGAIRDSHRVSTALSRESVGGVGGGEHGNVPPNECTGACARDFMLAVAAAQSRCKLSLSLSASMYV